MNSGPACSFTNNTMQVLTEEDIDRLMNPTPCGTCGHVDRPRKYSFSNIHAGMLEKAAQYWQANPEHPLFTLHVLSLSNSEYSCFQQLKYWGLIYPGPDTGWGLTPRGGRFLKDREHIGKHILICNNKALGWSAPFLSYVDFNRIFPGEPNWLGYEIASSSQPALL